MPKIVLPLTDAQLCAAVPRDKPYKLSDGRGLYLEIAPTGTRLWRMNFTFNGKESRMSFGAWPDVSLETARSEREKVRHLLAEGKHPTDERREQQRQARAMTAVHSPWREFHLSMDDEGMLTIDQSPSRIVLSALRVTALRAFLAATDVPSTNGD